MSPSAPDFTEKTLTSSDGTKIYSIAAGNPKHSALVFIHGFGLSSFVFEGLLRESVLLEKFYLVAYDVRGHGRSGKSDNPEDHQSSLYAADFDAVLRAFEVTKPLIVAWSMGGIVVADVCAHLPPGTISGIVYVNGAPYLGEALAKVGTPYILEVLPLLLSTDNVAASCEARIKFVEACFSKPDTLPAQLKWSWIGATVTQPPIVAALTVTRSQDPSKLLQAAEAGLPALAIVSTADSIIQGDNVEEILKGHFKNLEVHRIANGSHTPFIDDKDDQPKTKSLAMKSEDLGDVPLSWCKREPSPVDVKPAMSSSGTGDVKKLRVRYFMDGVVITRKKLDGNYISISEYILKDKLFSIPTKLEQEDTKNFSSTMPVGTRKALAQKRSPKVKREDEMKRPGGAPQVDAHTKKEEEEDLDIIQLWRNPAIKVEPKVEAMKLDPASVRSRIEEAGISLIPYPINCSPEILNTQVSRLFMSGAFGGSSQKTFPNISDKFRHDMRDFMFPSGDSQPEIPRLPGAPGLWLNIEYGDHDGCVYRLFARVQKSPAKWLYQGQYELKRSRSLTRDEWVQQKVSVRNAWIKDLFRKGWGVPMKIQIYALNRWGRKPTPAEAEDIVARDLYKSIQETDIARALTRGDQSLAIYTLQCVGYDVAFQKQIKTELANYIPPPPKRKAQGGPQDAKLPRPTKRRRTASSNGHESDGSLSNDDRAHDFHSDKELE